MARSGRPRSQEVDKAIEKAALSLFAQGGLAAANFDQVAKQAGVSRAALYRRWRSREELIVSALRAHREEAEAGLEDWAERPLAEVLELFVTQTVAAFQDPFARNLLRQLVASAAEEKHILQSYWELILAPRRAAFRRQLLRARARGELAAHLDPDLMQDLLSGALFYRLLIHPAEPTFDIKAYLGTVLAAVGFPQSRS